MVDLEALVKEYEKNRKAADAETDPARSSNLYDLTAKKAKILSRKSKGTKTRTFWYEKKYECDILSAESIEKVNPQRAANAGEFAGMTAIAIAGRTGSMPWLEKAYTVYRKYAEMIAGISPVHSADLYLRAGNAAFKLNEKTEQKNVDPLKYPEIKWAKEAILCYEEFLGYYTGLRDYDSINPSMRKTIKITSDRLEELEKIAA
ncbi:hypothetical protein GOV06_00890 [Candidatus Woesearchaeota archaeon]|nr:hypothetical protein [Candidatus Woesearchaeota archaeon]